MEYVETACQNPLAILNLTEAASTVTGDTRLTSIKHLYTETGWQKLSERREAHKIVQFYKMVNSQNTIVFN